MKKTTVWHDIIKLIKTIVKEKLLKEASSRGKKYYTQNNKDMDASNIFIVLKKKINLECYTKQKYI